MKRKFEALGSVQTIEDNVATVCVRVNVEQLDAQYKYIARLWDQQFKSKGKPCDELEGLCGLLEDMLETIEAEGRET